MGDQPPTEYQNNERLAQCQDIVRAAFCEGSGRNDQRGAQADMRHDTKHKRSEKDLQNFRFELRVSNYYKALYAAVMKGIEDTQDKICQAIITTQGRLQTANVELDTLLDKANKLPDGTPVFQYEEGTVKTDTGRVLDEQERASLVWRDDMPKGEAFDRARQNVDDINNGLLTLQGYDADMQGYAAQAAALENTDTSESTLTLQDISQKVREVDKNVVKITNSQATLNTKPTSAYIPPTNLIDYSQ